MSEFTTSPVAQSSTHQTVQSVEMSSPSPAPEAAPKAPEPAAEPAPRLGPKFAELAKREKAQFQREEAIKAQQAQLLPIQEAIAQAKQNPLALLEAAGLTYEQITDFILTDGLSAQEDTSVEKKLSDLQAKIEAKEAQESKAQEDAQQAKIDSQISALKTSIAQEVSTNPEYELTNNLGHSEMVYDVMISHHAETGVVLPIYEALALVEAYLTEQSQKILTAKKFTQASQQSVPEQKALNTKSPFTINRQASSSPTSLPSTEKLTPEQNRERALSMVRYK